MDFSRQKFELWNLLKTKKLKKPTARRRRRIFFAIFGPNASIPLWSACAVYWRYNTVVHFKGSFLDLWFLGGVHPPDPTSCRIAL